MRELHRLGRLFLPLVAVNNLHLRRPAEEQQGGEGDEEEDEFETAFEHVIS